MTWALVGRDEELGRMGELLGDPGCRGLAVVGDPGVGTSRLVRELLATRSEHVEAFQATTSAQQLPFGALARLVPEVAEHDEPPVPFARLVRSLSERCGERPLLVSVDDAHLLDDASAAFVHHLATEHLARVVLTVRSGVVGPDAVTRLYRDGTVARLDLRPLSRSAADGLVERVLGGPVERLSADRLWTATRGNLLFLRELLVDAIETGRLRLEHGLWRWTGGLAPGTRLVEVVASILRGLPPAVKDVLELVAVGEPLEVTVVETMTTGEGFAEAERRGLVRSEWTDAQWEVRSAHPLYGEVVRSTMPIVTRRKLQRHLADQLSAHEGGSPASRLRVAVWRLDGGGPLEPERLTDAAATALALSQLDLAERLSRAALRSGGGFETALVLGRVLQARDRYLDAEAVLAPLAGHERSDVEREQLAYARAGCVGWGLGRVDDGLAILRDAASRSETSATRSLIEAHQATLLAYAARFGQAADLGARALAAVDDDAVRVRALTSVGISLVMSGRIDEALAMSERELPVALALRDRLPRAPGWVMANRTTALVFAGRFDEAEELLDRAEELLPVAAPGTLAQVNAYRGRVALARGRAQRARRLLLDAAATVREHRAEVPPAWCLSLAAEATALLGDVTAAEQLADEARALRVTSMPAFEADAARARAWVRACRGERSAAVRSLRAAADRAAGRGQRVFEMVALHDAVRLGAIEDTDRLVAGAAEIDGEWAAAVGAHARALSIADLRAVVEAGDRFALLGMDLVAAEVHGAAAVGFRAEGLRRRAAESERSARELLSRCQPARPPGFPAPPAARLTRREWEVAGLAARRSSNAAIAATLGVSVRTVESHLYAVFAKLGISERGELAAVLDRLV